MSGLVGSLEAASTEFNNIPKGKMGPALQACRIIEYEVERAEKELVAEKQKVTLQEELDSAVLTDEIRMDMGEELDKPENEQDLER